MKKARILLVSIVASWLLALPATALAAPGVFEPFELFTVPVGSAPGAIAHSPDTGKVFVGNTGSGTVSVIDEATGEVFRTVAVGPAPHGIAINPATARVYVALGETNKVAVLNAVNGAALRAPITIPQCTGVTGPWGIAVHPGTDIVYVACYSAGFLVAVDGITGVVLRSVATGGGPLGVVVDPATNLVYLGMFGESHIRILDAVTLDTVATVRSGISAGVWGLALDPATHRVFAANFFNGTITTILGARVIGTAGGFSGPEWIAFDAARNNVWVPEFHSNRVTALDTLTGDVFPVAITGTRPTAVAVNPAGFVYSANFGTLNVSVILT